MGKGTAAAPPAVAPVDSSNDSLMLMRIMQSMGSQSSTMPALPTITAPPDMGTADSVDWSAKIKELTADAANTYSDDAATKKGRSETIHTKSLLDEETPKTTGDLL